MKKLLTMVVALFLAGTGCQVEDAAGAAPPPVELRWHGNPVDLNESAVQDLTGQAIRLVESSNFHSGEKNSLPRYQLPGAIGDVQQEYRELIGGGNFIVVSFPAPRQFQTIGGAITVSQIVIGLNHDKFAWGLLTINEANSVVSHGKYLGEYCVAFMQSVRGYLPAEKSASPSSPSP